MMLPSRNDPSFTAITHASPLTLRPVNTRRFTTGHKLSNAGIMAAVTACAVTPLWVVVLLAIPGVLPITAAALVGLFWLAAGVERSALRGNAGLREACFQDLRNSQPYLAGHCLGFVGFATRAHLRGSGYVLDTHEDVGALCTLNDTLSFHGERYSLSIVREHITAINVRIDPSYSWIGLHWIRITYEASGRAEYYYLQSRDADRLSAQPNRNRALLRKLRQWWIPE